MGPSQLKPYGFMYVRSRTAPIAAFAINLLEYIEFAVTLMKTTTLFPAICLTRENTHFENLVLINGLGVLG